MFDIYINNDVVLTVNELKTAKRIADSIKETGCANAVVVRRHRQDIGVVYEA